jgi:hypothetical protein
VAALEAADVAPLPAAFVARTVKVYEVPLVRPVTVQVVLAVVQVKPPGDAVARYDVTAEPFAAAALHDTGTCVFWPLVAVTPVGVPGVV